MNSIIVVSMLLAVLCASVNARLQVGVFRHPEHPGKCHLDEGLILKSGEVVNKPNNRCEMVTCFENEHATIVKCVPQKMREGCMEGKLINPEAGYPDCCKREIMCRDHYYST